MSSQSEHVPVGEVGASIATRLAAVDWALVEAELNGAGWASLGQVLTPAECSSLRDTYGCPVFRSTISMQRHGFGRGEYKYFSYPLPAIVAGLRSQLYAHLAAPAKRWQDKLGIEGVIPDSHDAYLEMCKAAGQSRPTPLLLRYAQGDYNCLHQDLYGEVHFPFQVVILLSEPGCDFEGGEFVLTEQRPRVQSRAHVVPLKAGEAAVFAVRNRPALGTRGTYRVTLRHGVSAVLRGSRYALGVILHDAA
ncbi:proline hydroxylase [Lysobacter daejeonensis GH1-9]|uniref:Proline hydroxylase n=1 Tax=Lysobacter daejeonensis GH1-9 TaxID=1385517 RepID=A0A0A0F4B4_9GAMM|nr:2OG-Fe(II) oxygenase [Lysobacter daejeonensis]KGM56232.1 proline hydroxylase [Lysobacter daejeonensis GH1-9]